MAELPDFCFGEGDLAWRIREVRFLASDEDVSYYLRDLVNVSMVANIRLQELHAKADRAIFANCGNLDPRI